MVEAGTPYETRGSDSGVQAFQTFFLDNEEGQGIIIPPRSILRMQVERLEIPFSTLKFEPKFRRHDLFESWVGRILAQPNIEAFLDDLSILRFVNLAQFMNVDRNSVDLVFFLSRWSVETHTFVIAWGELW